jgi:hypothetical protein
MSSINREGRPTPVPANESANGMAEAPADRLLGAREEWTEGRSGGTRDAHVRSRGLCVSTTFAVRTGNRIARHRT